MSPASGRDVVVRGRDAAGEREDQGESVLGDCERVSAGRVDDQDAVCGRGVQVHLGGGGATDADEPEIGGVGEGLLEHEVGLHHQYRDAFSADAGSQIVRVGEPESVQPAFVSDAHLGGQTLKLSLVERGQNEGAHGL